MSRKTRWHPSRVGLVMLVVLSPLALPAAEHGAPPANRQEAQIDATAVAALERMGRALRALKKFTLTSDASTEVVLDNGQKIELDGQVKYEVEPPRRLFLDISSDRAHRQLFYDGNTMTLYSPRLKYYASVDGVDATLGELAGKLWADYGIELPLTDLFLWGGDKPPRNPLTSAIYVGAGSMDGDRIDQYAFRQPGVDWQVWIGQADSLPRKIAITSHDDPALPTYTARLKWDTTPAIDSNAFTFVPPQGSARIELLVIDAVAMQPKEK